MKISGFEEMVLLAVGSLGDNAYGVTIKETLDEKMGKNQSIGALHAALFRLEEQGYLSAREGGATNNRGGRKKKYYKLTAYGRKALMSMHAVRMDLARKILDLKLS